MMREQTFDDWVLLPENAERLFELINGEIVEKVPDSVYASHIAVLIGFYIRLWMQTLNIAGRVTDGQGGYMVNGERYAPDVGYISKARQPKLTRGYNPNPPELAVEVEFPTTVESERRLRIKVLNYLAVGTVVWVVYPETREVECYVPGQPVLVLSGDDAVIDGGAVLPGFTLALSAIFVEDIPE
jgi:Uma2 family endonuclease